MKHLKSYYDKVENIHVEWVKAATLRQNCGRSELEFLLKVEHKVEIWILHKVLKLKNLDKGLPLA